LKVLVTGGAGFIGSNLAKGLVAAGHETTLCDDFSSATWNNLVGFRGNVVTCEMFRDVGISGNMDHLM
jgi:ADP-L-glycero-D-manno-heptose 6-epimerase